METADKLELLKATKADLKAALNEQGQTPGDVFSDYPDMVRAIQTSVTPSISVSSAGLITATAGDKSATKQLTTQSGRVMMPSVSEQLAVETGVYTTGPIYVQGDASLLPENIKSGVSIFGVTGTASGGYKVKDIYNAIVFSEATLSNGTLTLKLPLAGDIVPKSLMIERMWFGDSDATTNNSIGRFRFSGGVRFDISEANVVMMVSTAGTGVESNNFTVSWSHDGTNLTMTITDQASTTLGEVTSGYSEMTRFQGELFYEE